jgi:hypothetical protein
LFKEWFDTMFVPEVKLHLKRQNLSQKALLLLDNATCHLSEEDLRSSDGNIQVMYFPANTTILQPLDQNILRALKQRYRKKLLTYLISRSGIDTAKKLKKT